MLQFSRFRHWILSFFRLFEQCASASSPRVGDCAGVSRGALLTPITSASARGHSPALASSSESYSNKVYPMSTQWTLRAYSPEPARTKGYLHLWSAGQAFVERGVGSLVLCLTSAPETRRPLDSSRLFRETLARENERDFHIFGVFLSRVGKASYFTSVSVRVKTSI